MASSESDTKNPRPELEEPPECRWPGCVDHESTRYVRRDQHAEPVPVCNRHRKHALGCSS
jgi:hypothetical protein